ncbi:hypothetical protein KUV89_17730 [Marinobacter hydrocarbonoclasticus]|nr:hypothetical protein [Marinobacter nauticus]
MEPIFKGAADGTPVPNYVKVAVDNTNPSQFEKVVVSCTRDGGTLSCYNDILWDLSSYRHTKKENPRDQINWGAMPISFVAEAKYAVYQELFEHSSVFAKGMNSAVSFASHLLRLTKVCQSLGMSQFAQLNRKESQGKLLAYYKAKGLAKGTLSTCFWAINKLSRHGVTRFRIDNIEAKAKKLAAPEKKEPDQTLAIPQALASQIVGNAITKIETWHQDRSGLGGFFTSYLELYLDEDRAAARRLVSKSNYISSSQFSGRASNGFPGANLVANKHHDILATCGVVIGAVTGMRFSEYFELDADSYQVKTFKGVTHQMLVGKTSKLNGGIPVRHAWITSPIAKTAVELLEAVTAGPRRRLQREAELLRAEGKAKAADDLVNLSTSLMLSLRANQRQKALTISPTSFDSAVERLVANAPAPDGSVGAVVTQAHLEEFKVVNRRSRIQLKVGDQWPAHSHQWRRTFAVFMVRNQFGTFQQVKQQFAHAKLSMSLWYGNNAEYALAFDLERNEEIMDELKDLTETLMIDTAEEIYLGNTKISGSAGDTIRSQRAQGVMVFESREEIEAAVRNGDITVIDNGHSLCLNPKCGRLDCTIDPVINPILCAHDVVLEEHAQARAATRDRLIKRHKAAIEQKITNQPNLMAKTLLGIRACEQVMTDHGMEFEPYGAVLDVREVV